MAHDHLGTRGSGDPGPRALETMKKRRGLAGIALGWLLVSSVALGCGQFKFQCEGAGGIHRRGATRLREQELPGLPYHQPRRDANSP